jgi:hypothetical protein
MISQSYASTTHLTALLMCYRLARERAWQIRQTVEIETASPGHFGELAEEAETETPVIEAEAS